MHAVKPTPPHIPTPSPPPPTKHTPHQVLNKQVITRTSGRALGSLCACWMDPGRRELVSFDVDDRRTGGGGGGAGLPLVGGAQRVGNLPLAALRQIGDVVLVHDEQGLYEQDLDGRLGFVNPIGLEVRTAAGEFLGKVRRRRCSSWGRVWGLLPLFLFFSGLLFLQVCSSTRSHLFPIPLATTPLANPTHPANPTPPTHPPTAHPPTAHPQVRDVSFSPDTGAIGRIAYDEFGLPSLPSAFFDCYSVGADEVLSMGRSEVHGGSGRGLLVWGSGGWRL